MKCRDGVWTDRLLVSPEGYEGVWMTVAVAYWKS